MIRSFTFSFALILLFAASGLSAQRCCKKPAGMQVWALNKEFKAAHETPLPLNYTPAKGSMIEFPVSGGPDGKAFYVPSDVPSDKVLIVFHEWWGLNDYIKREAENWQKMLAGKVAVYAADLYDGNVASTPDEAGKLASTLDTKRGKAVVSGLLQRIGNDKNIATIGWCMGGSWSFNAAVLAGREAKGCVMYYGFPEKDINNIKPLKCDVLYIRGNKDTYITGKDVDEFKKKVKSQGHNITSYSFDAVHAFANPSNPKYDAKAAGEAQAISLKFLKSKLSVE
jgi:carboxymethylenebutenolidase